MPRTPPPASVPCPVLSRHLTRPSCRDAACHVSAKTRAPRPGLTLASRQQLAQLTRSLDSLAPAASWHGRCLCVPFGLFVCVCVIVCACVPVCLAACALVPAGDARRTPAAGSPAAPCGCRHPVHDRMARGAPWSDGTIRIVPVAH